MTIEKKTEAGTTPKWDGAKTLLKETICSELEAYHSWYSSHWPFTKRDEPEGDDEETAQHPRHET